MSGTVAALALSSAFLSAAATILIRQGLRGYGPYTGVWINMLVGTVCLWVAVLVTGGLGRPTPTAFALFVLAGLIGTVAGRVLRFFAIETVGASITGGYVYRGSALGASYRGRYFFGDFVRSRVWSIALAVDPDTGEATASNRIEHTAELGGSSALGGVSSFGIDANGELYIVSYAGAVLQIIGATTVPSTPVGLRILR